MNLVMALLGSAQRRDFADNGFLIVPGFFEERELDAATDAYETVWRDLPSDVVVDFNATGRRTRAKDITREERRESIKVNDLYLRDHRLRQAVLSARLGAILGELFADEPVVVNTLSVEYGTQQADHLDTLYMTPRTPGKLLATWMALEDVDEDAGPLRYYPGSNHIEPYRFDDGGFHFRTPEMEQWSTYMASAVERRGLGETTFMARRGDLLIWDAWLLHGGSEICTPGLTRRSLITHYYTKSDCKALNYELRPVDGGHWLKRATQPVPGEEAGAEQPPIDAPAGSSVGRREPRPLYDRLMSLDPRRHLPAVRNVAAPSPDQSRRVRRRATTTYSERGTPGGPAALIRT